MSPPTKSLTLRNGTLALPHGLVRGDLHVIDGKIAAIGEITADLVRESDAHEELDASHLLVMPGVIDPQVHFREPGLTHKEDLGSGSRACAAGGVTTFLEMPNTSPPTTTEEALAWKYARAAETAVVDHGFFIGATASNVELLDRVPGAVGIKIFMGSSTGDLLVNERADLERIFASGRRLIAVHAEDEARLRARKPLFAHRTDPAAHTELRDAECARLATELAMELSEKYQRRLHILHMTTRDEVELLATRGKGDGRVTAECLPQHLVLNAPEIYERIGTRAQMNPPLRTKEHTEGLWRGLHAGLIDCIATDHAPHTLEEKALGFGKAPSGMPGVETSLAVMLDAAARGLCTVEDVVRWMCDAPARCYRIEHKGRIELGFDADLALVDLGARRVVGARPFFTRVGWSPFEGMELQGWPVTTIVRGQIVFRDGQIVEGVRGRPVQLVA
ncbi:dihydroorotase [Myxococcota bacterium]|nr:dihydroorotase [Myxococcota bacterium]